jgi:hypothetical protein
MKRLVMATAALSGLFLGTLLLGSAQEQPKGMDWVREMLARKVKVGPFEDPKVTVADVIDGVQRRYDLPIQVNEQAFKADGIDDVMRFELCQEKPLKEMNAPLAVILNRILDRIPTKNGAVVLLQKDGISITTMDAFRAEFAGSGTDTTPMATPIGPLVQRTWEQVSLAEAVRQIVEDTEANIVIDPRAREKANANVITARLRNVPLRTAVRILADMAGLEVIQIDNVYYVSSPEHIQKLTKEQEKQAGGGTVDRDAVPAGKGSGKAAPGPFSR